MNIPRTPAVLLLIAALILPAISFAADENVTGNLTVSGTSALTGVVDLGSTLDVAGNDLTLGTQSSSYGLGTFFLPSGTEGARWRLRRVSDWLWEVDNSGSVTPAMRLDASNNLILYNGGTARLTLNPSATSLTLGTATLSATGTAFSTNGALSVGGTLATTGALTATTAAFASGLNNTPIGNSTPSTGVFTTLTATSLSTATISSPGDLALSSANGVVKVESTTDFRPLFTLTNVHNGPNSAHLYFRKSRGATVAAGDNLGILGFQGRSGNGQYNLGATVVASVISAGSTYIQGRLRFSTVDGTGVSADRLTIDSSTATFAVPTTLFSASTTSTTPATGAVVVTGGAGIGENLSVGKKLFGSATLTAFDTGLSDYHRLEVAGAGAAGGGTDFRTFVVTPSLTGAVNATALIAFEARPTHSGTAVATGLTGYSAVVQLQSSGAATHAKGFRATPKLTGAGHINGSWTAFEAGAGSFGSTGNLTGTVAGFKVENLGRATATQVNAIDVNDQTKGSGDAVAFRGRMVAGTGKYNLYLDGTAANVLAGQTTISNATAATSSTTGALVVAGGMGVAGDLWLGGTLRTGGTGSMNFTGNVGIGTNTPGAPLELYQASGTTPLLRLNSGLAGGNAVDLNPFIAGTSNAGFEMKVGGTQRLVVNGVGQVGVGTANPQAGLDVFNGIHVHGAPAYATSGAGLEILKINDSLGSISMINGPDRTERELRFYGTPLAFFQGGSEKMRVANNGNVGIGAANPQGKLDLGDGTGGGSLVWGGGDGAHHYASIGTAYSSAALGLVHGLKLDPSADRYLYSYATIARAGVRIGGGTTGDISFFSAPSSTQTVGAAFDHVAGTKVMIKENGNVGIGTTVPATRLHLQGPQTELSMSTATDPTAYNRFGFNSSYVGYWAQNAYWNGSQWNYVNPGGYGGAAVKLQQFYGAFQIDTAVAGGSTDPVQWITRLYVANAGGVGIGTTNLSDYKLSVGGKIRATEVVVDTGWADYVFEEDYRLAPLSEVEAHIREKKHLPGIPSAAEVAAHGVSMGDMQSKLLAKVEELTLHLIRLEKENDSLRTRVQNLEGSAAAAR